VKDEEHLISLFHQTELAVRSEGKYSDSGEGKLRRTLPSILGRVDIKEKRERAGTIIPFDKIPEEDIQGMEDEQVEKEVAEDKEYRYRYAKLLEERFHCEGQVKRSIFDGMAYIKHRNKMESIESDDIVKTLRDEIRVRNRREKDPSKKLKGSEVADAMTAHRMTLKEELLLDIEEWDGVDRIHHLSTLVNFGNEITQECFEYFLKDWIVRCVHKVVTGRGTNRMLVFQGGQGVGKDSFLGMLYGGWTGDYSREVSAPGKYDGEDVLMEQVYNVAVASLRELDRFDPVHLKRLIDNECFSFRQKYAKNTVNHRNRVSFVASCNPQNPFRDETGNRRFLFFRINGRADTPSSAENYPHLPIAIKRDFDDQDQKYKNQVLAQAFKLWRDNGQQPLPLVTKHESLMQRLLDEATPDDASIDVLEQFDVFFKKLLAEREGYSDFRRLISRQELKEDQRFEAFCKSVDMKSKDVEQELERSGRRSKETNPRLLSGQRFFHLLGEFTIEEREKAKRWNDGCKFDVEEEQPY
jgi:hypothetical protein